MTMRNLWIAGVRKPAEVRSEVRKWSQGCYTLVHDTDTDMSEYALDAMFFSACPGLF